MIYKECNVYPLYYNRIFRVIGFWLKIIKLDDNNPLKIIYSASITNDVYNVNNLPLSWSNNVKSILYTNGFGYIWESQNLGINKHFMHTFKNRLIDSFWQSNNAAIELLSKNRIYRHLTTESCFYIKVLNNNFIREAITKLRLGSHYLNIERGRWHNTALADRKCNLCNDIEDEYHFVVICVKYYDLRIKYLPKTLYTNPSMYKFLNFLNKENNANIKKLGLYLHFAFKQFAQEEIMN